MPSDGDVVRAIGGWAEVVVDDGEVVGYVPVHPSNAPPRKRCPTCGQVEHSAGPTPVARTDGGGSGAE